MSLVTAMDSYDAQMLDETDVYTGSSTADSWLSREATMTDAGLEVDSEFLQQDHESIEVDMMDHEEITEYEMADEERYPTNDEELRDVDLHDTSQAPSPPHAAILEEVPLLQVDTPIVPDGSNPASDTRFPSAAPESDFEAVEPADVHSPYSNLGGVVVSNVTRSTSPAQDADLHRSNLAEVASDPAMALRQHISTSDTSSSMEDTATIPPAANDVPLLPAEPDHDYAAQQHSHGKDGPSDSTYATSHIPPADVANIDPPNASEHVSIPQEVESEEQVDLSTRDTESSVRDETSNGSGNPLEISDGVYIDPPPAVLLSLCFTPEPLECCLFNLPLSSPSSQSPSGSITASNEALALVLHDRPTLYYEPLSAVFEALRQEEYLQDLPNFADGELVVDAYDLHLVVSEDNLHVHEVTLHDLNVLHDGADLFGPLRLQLRATVPRFIHRYRALRDQIARLDLAADGAEEERGASHGFIDQQEGSTTAATGGEYVSESEQFADARNAEHDKVESHPEYLDGGSLLDTEGRDEEAPVDPPLLHSIQALDTAHNGGPTDDFDDAENVNDSQDEVGLDTDEVHRYADAEEGGDYEEYGEYVEDDDERFGEELPEDLGGQDDTNGHEELYDDPEKILPAVDHSNESVGLEHGDSETTQVADAEDDFDSHTLEEHPYDPEAPEDEDDGETVHTDVSGSTHEDQDLEYNVEDKNDIATATSETQTKASPTTSSSENYHATSKDDIRAQTPQNTNKSLRDVEELISDTRGSDPTDAPSRKSSSTLSTRSSKRGHDEVDSVGDVDGESPPSSPDSKRLRVL